MVAPEVLDAVRLEVGGVVHLETPHPAFHLHGFKRGLDPQQHCANGNKLVYTQPVPCGLHIHSLRPGIEEAAVRPATGLFVLAGPSTHHDGCWEGHGRNGRIVVLQCGELVQACRAVRACHGPLCGWAQRPSVAAHPSRSQPLLLQRLALTALSADHGQVAGRRTCAGVSD